jgi:hypothetical protein
MSLSISTGERVGCGGANDVATTAVDGLMGARDSLDACLR